MSEYNDKIVKSFMSIGVAGATKHGINDATSAAMMEYAIAKQLKSMAEKREAEAKAEAITLLQDKLPAKKGKLEIYSDDRVAIVLDNRDAPLLLDQALLLNNLCKKFKLSVIDAQDFIDTCKQRKQPFTQYWTTVIK